MQAVILAAGKGTRMGTLTESTPKVMLKVAGRTLLEHKFDALPEEIDEIILVIGYLGGVIHDYFGGNYKGRTLLYVEQEEFKGTADALWRAKDILKDRFLVLNGDDLYTHDDIQKCLAKKEGWVHLVQEINGTWSGGNVEVDPKDRIIGIKEGGHTGSGLIGANAFAFDARIFECEMIPKSRGSEEFGLPQTALEASKKLGVPFHAIRTTSWFQITSPDDLKRAEELINAS